MACSTIGLMTLVPDPALLLLPYREALPSGSPPLRVAVVVNRNPPSPWVRALLTFLQQIPGLDVHLLYIATGHPPESTRPAWLIDRLYSASRAKFIGATMGDTIFRCASCFGGSMAMKLSRRNSEPVSSPFRLFPAADSATPTCSF